MGLKKLLVTGVATCGLLLGGGIAASAAENQSVVDYLYVKGENYSFAHRAELAAQYGIVGYKGTAAQNIALLGKLQGAPVSAPAPAQTQEAAPAVKAATTTEAQPSGKTMTMTATAYTANCAGCSGITYTGINLKANPNQKVIAVDPRVIPLGSKVYVEGYGTAIAGDTGGAIKGNRIDIFIPDQASAMAYGIKTVKVTILN